MAFATIPEPKKAAAEFEFMSHPQHMSHAAPGFIISLGTGSCLFLCRGHGGVRAKAGQEGMPGPGSAAAPPEKKSLFPVRASS